MNIPEWAKFSGMTPEQYKNEVVKTMAAVGAMDLKEKDDGSSMVVYTVQAFAGPMVITVEYIK